ncbi:hypothetical protein EC991_000550 [Linnemannia zychae]|nr:hypothetical protein EC991_000550 [Linnemannia zychae]
MSSPQQHQQLHTVPPGLTNIDLALEGVVKNFMRSEKYARKIKHHVRATSAPGRQNYKFAPATALTPQETKFWRTNLMQDEIASNNPFWTARWMRVFGISPKLDDSLLKVPWIKCERPGSNEGDPKAALPLHRKETYLDLRDDQNRNWAMDSFQEGIAFAQKGQLDDAIKAYSQAIQIDSKCIEGYIARGCTLANMKKWRAAVMDFRAALGLDPLNISARQYLETTIAQEEEHRLNPPVEINAQRAPSNQLTTAPPASDAFDPNSNLDNINEIVLDTENMNMADNANKANPERKKKKKKNKRVATGVTIVAMKEAETGVAIEAEIEVGTGVMTEAVIEVGTEVVIEMMIDIQGDQDGEDLALARLGHHGHIGGSQYHAERTRDDRDKDNKGSSGDKDKEREKDKKETADNKRQRSRTRSRSVSRERSRQKSDHISVNAHSPLQQKHDTEERTKDPVKKEKVKELDAETTVSAAKEHTKDTLSRPREAEHTATETKAPASVAGEIKAPVESASKDKLTKVPLKDEKDAKETVTARSSSKDRSDDKKVQDPTKAFESGNNNKRPRETDTHDDRGRPRGRTPKLMEGDRSFAVGQGVEVEHGMPVDGVGRPVKVEMIVASVERGVIPENAKGIEIAVEVEDAAHRPVAVRGMPSQPESIDESHPIEQGQQGEGEESVEESRT